MKGSKFYIWTVCILAIFSLTLVNYYAYYRLRKIETNYNRLVINNLNWKNSYSELQERFMKSINKNGVNLEDIITENNINIKTPLFGLIFPQLSCTTCMDSLLHQLNRSYTDELKSKLYIFIDESQEYYMNKFKRFHQYNFPNIISLNMDKYDFMNKSGDAFFLIINQSYVSEMCYFPDKKKFEETKFYISYVKSKFLDFEKK